MNCRDCHQPDGHPLFGVQWSDLHLTWLCARCLAARRDPSHVRRDGGWNAARGNYGGKRLAGGV